MALARIKLQFINDTARTKTQGCLTQKSYVYALPYAVIPPRFTTIENNSNFLVFK